MKPNLVLQQNQRTGEEKTKRKKLYVSYKKEEPKGYEKRTLWVDQDQKREKHTSSRSLAP